MDNIGILQSEKISSLRLTEFCQDILRKTSLLYIAWLMVALAMAFGVYFVWRDSALTSIWPSLFVYYLIALVHFAFRLRTGGKANILAPDIFYLMFYTMFHLGYVTLYRFGLAPYIAHIFFYESSVPRALLIVNLGLVGFLFGYELMAPKSDEAAVREPVKIPTRYWCTFGFVIMVIALGMHVIPLSIIGPDLLSRYGYGAIIHARRYVSHTVAMFLSQSNPLMVFGISIYMISSSLRYGKLFHLKLASGLVIAMMALNALEGNRGPIIQLGLPILLVRHYFVKRVRIRYLVMFFFAITTVFAGIGLVRRIALEPTRMWQEYKYQKKVGVVGWRSPFLEAGGSFKVTAITSHDVPSVEPYWKGKSYLSAALHTIPFLEGYCTRQGWLGPYSYWPSKWISATYVGERYGLGFTIATEGYLNFGLPGAFLELMLMGLFLRWLGIRFAKKPSAARAFIMLGILGVSFGVIRGHIQLLTNRVFQIFVIAAFVSMFCGNESELEPEQFETSEDLAGQLYAEYDKLQYE